MADHAVDGPAHGTPPAPAPCEFDEQHSRWSCQQELTHTPEHEAPHIQVEVFRIVSEHFRQDISSFWGHATFYVVLQGALATVFATVVGPRDRDSVDGLLSSSVLALLLALAGLLFAVAWGLAGAGRRRLIGAWRNEVLHQEALVVPRHRSYERVERLAATLPLEPTSVTMFLPVVLAVAWASAAVWASLRIW